MPFGIPYSHHVAGYAGGAQHGDNVGGTNYLCLPKDPQWRQFSSARDKSRGHVYGAEYRLHDAPFYQGLHFQDVPCAVCHVQGRSSVIMVPAKRSCEPGWTRVHYGYIMTERSGHASNKEDICMDISPQTVDGGTGPDDLSALFYPVQAICGSLKYPSITEN